MASVWRDFCQLAACLRLERRDPVAVLSENAAQRRAKQAFPGVRARALNHDEFCHDSRPSLYFLYLPQSVQQFFARVSRFDRRPVKAGAESAVI